MLPFVDYKYGSISLICRVYAPGRIHTAPCVGPYIVTTQKDGGFSVWIDGVMVAGNCPSRAYAKSLANTHYAKYGVQQPEG